MNRIFISYRTVDGAKDASRLADDLGRVFGSAHVFLDRQDIRGGTSWRQEIDSAIGCRPVVLLLITPGFAGARHADGRLRIEDADDPVRMEVESAIAAGAALMPLCVDGTPMPAGACLPASIRQIAEARALPLCTDDWAHNDLPRIVADIEKLGVPRVDIRTAANARSQSRRVRWALAATLLLGVAGTISLNRSGDIELPDTAAGIPSPTESAEQASHPLEPLRSLAGTWVLTTQSGSRVALDIRQDGDALELRSEPVRIDNDPDWKGYLDSIANLPGPPISHIVYSARGELFGRQAELKVVIARADRGTVIDSGKMNLHIGPESRVLAGRVSLDSGESETVVLARRP